MTDSPTTTGGVTAGLKVFMFTDLVDSSALARRLGDADYVRCVLEPHNEIFRRLLAQYPDAQEVKHTGDGFMATFASASGAADFGLRLHHALRTAAWERVTPQTRVGIHLGEAVEFTGPTEGDHDLAGDAANVTARVMGLAGPGQTLMTRVAFDSARQTGRVRAEWLDPGADGTKPQVQWLHHGRYRLKGVDEPLEVCEVGLAGLAPLRPPADSEKSRRVVSDEEAELLGWRPSPGCAIPHRSDWILEESLGAGGFGEVWLASHRRTRERRAFKFCFDAEKLRSFKRELTFFRLIRDHLGERPDIGRLYEVHVDQAPFLLESEYVAGGNLKQWSDARGGIGALPLELRLRLLTDVARAVAAAHSLGIIHKDLKPSNVLIAERDGHVQPKLVDFGIGILTDPKLLEQHQITETGFTESLLLGSESSRTGTRLYQPPEAQVNRPATTAADVYAMGVMLYQLVTADLSRPLGTGWEEDVADELLREDIRVCTHRDPERRLGSAADLAERLESLPQRRAALEAERRAADQARRLHRLRAGLAIAAVSLAVLGGLAAWTYVQWQHSERSEMLAQQRAEETRRQLYISDIRLVARELKEGNTRTALALLARHKEDEDLRGFEWHYLGHLFRSELLTLEGHDAPVRHVVFGPDGTWIASGSGGPDASGEPDAEDQGGPPPSRNGPSIRLWDIATGKELVSLKVDAAGVTSLAVSPDGTLLASASAGGVQIWDVSTGDEHVALGESARGPVTFSPDGKWLAHTYAAGFRLFSLFVFDREEVRLSRTDTGEKVRGLYTSLVELLDSVTSLDFNSDGTRLAAGSLGGKVAVLDAATAEEFFECGQRMVSPVTFGTVVTFSPDGTRLAVAGADGIVRVRDAATGDVLLDLGRQMGVAFCVAFSPDGRRLAVGGMDGIISVRDAATGEELLALVGHAGPVLSVAFSPDGRRLASGSRDKSVKLWDVARESKFTELRGHAQDVAALAFSPDGKQLASCGRNAAAIVWDVTTGQRLRRLPAARRIVGVPRVAFLPDGRHLVTSGHTSQDPLALWDTSAGREVLQFGRHESSPRAADAASSADGTWHASFQSATTVLRNVATGEEVLRLPGQIGTDSCAAFSPDGKRLACGTREGTLTLWDLAAKREIVTVKAHGDCVSSLAFEPGGRRLASGSEDGTVKLWDVTTRETLLTLEGHRLAVGSLAFSPDGRRLASGSVDGRIKLWDVALGQEVLTLRGHDGAVGCLAFSPDGRRLASGGSDRIIRLWDARPDSEELRVERRAVSLVRFLIDSGFSKAEVLEHIEGGRTLGEPVREKALTLARPLPEECYKPGLAGGTAGRMRAEQGGSNGEPGPVHGAESSEDAGNTIVEVGEVWDLIKTSLRSTAKAVSDVVLDQP